jgi:hypothetical protein
MFWDFKDHANVFEILIFFERLSLKLRKLLQVVGQLFYAHLCVVGQG